MRTCAAWLAWSVVIVASSMAWVACGVTPVSVDPDAGRGQGERVDAARQRAEGQLGRELTPGASAVDGADPTNVQTLTSAPGARAGTPGSGAPSPAPQPFTQAKWIEASGAAYLQSRSGDEAEHLALRKALENAVRIAAGEKVDVTQLQIVTENDSQFRDAFIQVSEVSVQGYVTEYRGPRWESLTVENPDKTRPPIPGFVARIEAYVVPPTGERDDAFWIRAALNHVTLREGDEVVITVDSSKTAYLTVFNIQSEGAVAVVVPSSLYVEELRVGEGESLVFPSGALHASGYRLRARVPRHMETAAESFLVVATREKVAPPRSQADGTLDITDLNRWLVDIPRNRRAEDVVGFTIAAK